MNFFPMNAGGGKLEETTLWTNSSPNSNFSAQEITLSESIENFDYVKIEYAFDTSYQTGNQKNGCIIDIVDVKKWLYTSGTRHVIGSLASSDGNNYEYTRDVFYISNTSLLFGTAYLVTTSSSANQMNIPLKVIGVKQTQGGGTVDPPALVGTTLWTNSSPTSTFASQTVNLSDNISDYDYIKIKYRYATDLSTEMSILMSTSDIAKDEEYHHATMYVGAHYKGVAHYVRSCRFHEGDTALAIDDCNTVNTTGTDNTKCIPFEIIGLKKTADYENEYNPQAIYNSSLNANSANTNISVTSGKTYSISYNDSNVYSSSSVTGGDILFETRDGGIDWGTRAYCYQLIVKATSSTMSITNSKNRVWSLIVVQLD